MKISAVCEQTGLTDRTVRFYTEEGLLNPSFTKNYLGRKTFDFSEEDVAMLKNIAVLRKYGFAIPEIKSILEDPAQSVAIIEALRQKKQETIQSEQELLDVLLTLEKGKPYTVPELAQALNTPKVEEIKPKEDVGCLSLVTEAGVYLFWVLNSIPLILAVLFWIGLIKTYCFDDFVRFPAPEVYWHWMSRTLVFSALPILFSVAMILICCGWFRRKTVLRLIAVASLVCCIICCGFHCMLLSALAQDGTHSETDDPVNYLVLTGHQKNKDEIIRLFPGEIPRGALSEPGHPKPESTLYYFYNDQEAIWSRYEIIAQWILPPDQLELEKNRIQDEFFDEIMNQGSIGTWNYWSMDMDPGSYIHGPENNQYTAYVNFLFFAYQEETGIVRYIAFYSDDCTHVPGFCSLNWN